MVSARRFYRGIEFVALDRQLLSNRAAIPSKLQDQRNGLINGAQRLVRNWHSFGRNGEKRKLRERKERAGQRYKL